jgi:Zn-finger nucleic acid-binding protein
MNCPICNSATSVEINTHSRGYAKEIMECDNCEAIWLNKDGVITILKARKAA